MTTRSLVLEHSLNLLLHPACLAAMLLLFLNDHLLRLYWPSWWTGKLGDFAWLFFAPLACTALLAWLGGLLGLLPGGAYFLSLRKMG